MTNEKHKDKATGKASFDALACQTPEQTTQVDLVRDHRMYNEMRAKFITYMKWMKAHPNVHIIGMYIGGPLEYNTPDPGETDDTVVDEDEWDYFLDEYRKMVKTDRTWA